MKKLIAFLLLFVVVIYIANSRGLFTGKSSRAITTYKEFMDCWIIRDFDRARQFTIGQAAEKVERIKGMGSMNFLGRTMSTPLAEKHTLEGSRIEVVNKTVSGKDASIEVVYSACISWPGAIVNPVSRKNWKHHRQKATLVEQGDGWKVSSFTEIDEK